MSSPEEFFFFFFFGSRNSSLLFLVLRDLSIDSCAKVLICVKLFFLRQRGMQAIKIFLFPNNPLYKSLVLVCEKSEKLQKFSYSSFPEGILWFFSCTPASGQQMALDGHQMADSFWNHGWVRF